MSITEQVRNRDFSIMRTAVSPLWGDPLELNFAATSLIVWNKSNGEGEALAPEMIEFSYDADHTEGELDPGEALTFDRMADGIRKVYVRSATGGMKVRVAAWQRGEIG